MTQKRQMNLTVFMLAPGYHFDSWRMPGSRAEEMGQFGRSKQRTQMARVLGQCLRRGPWSRAGARLHRRGAEGLVTTRRRCST